MEIWRGIFIFVCLSDDCNMKKYKIYSWIKVAVLIRTGLWLFGACANKGYPEGGPKDSIPPTVVMERPLSYNTNFKDKKINIYFNEFVQLKEMNEKFIISPPQKRKPRVKLRGKYIQVEFRDTLVPDVTYSLDFGDAIVDNNEGNPLGFYRYVFSTGNVIDTMEMSGHAYDAESGRPVLGASVFLYKRHGDSIPLLEFPDYVSRTDSAGFFHFTNISDVPYRVLALNDADRNYTYLPEDEFVGFIDTVVVPWVCPLSEIVKDSASIEAYGYKFGDKILPDSCAVNDSLWAYGPTNLSIRMFKERLTKLYMSDAKREKPYALDFVFSVPGENGFNVSFADSTFNPTDWYIKEESPGRDSIRLWIRDSLIYETDTLAFYIDYFQSDSLNRTISVRDTSYMVYKKKKTPRRRKDTVEKKIMNIVTDLSDLHDVNKPVYIEFPHPVDNGYTDNIKLYAAADTVFQDVVYGIYPDSVRIRRFKIECEWEPEREYILKIDSATICDIYGYSNNKIEKKFKIPSLDFYARLILNVSGLEGHVVMQLFKTVKSADNQSKPNTLKVGDEVKYEIVCERNLTGDGQVVIDYLKPGTVGVRFILDENANGKWDTGLYLEKRQPEKIIYFPDKVIDLKANFDIEQDFDLKAGRINIH